jgi:hypothetical protein
MNLLGEFYLQKYERQLISKKESAIKEQIRTLADYVCQGDIREKYIDNALKHFEFGYIYRDTENADNLVGFVLWSIKTHPQFNKVLHINLICGRALGLWMMKDVEQTALLQNINIITLDPANDKLKQVYINKYGFKVKAELKSKEKDIYYKDIRNNIYSLSKPNSYNTIKKNKSKRRTLKKKNKKGNENNINNFIRGATSRTNKIINLNNL